MPAPNPGFRTVDPDTTPKVTNQYTQALVYKGIVYVSGTPPWDRERQTVGKDITEQTQQSLKNIDTVLKEAGSSRGSVIKINCYLHNMERDFVGMELVLREWFGEHRPARINLNNPLLAGGVLVEIEAIAAVDEC